MKNEQKLQWITYVGLLIFLLFSLLYFFGGVINTDEGWFLYAGKLVYEGKIPYRDFAFTQMPLLPYVYGLGNLIGAGLYGGRFISLVFSVTAISISIVTAHKIGGKFAAAMTATMLAAFPLFIYFLIITKVYALITLFFSITLYALIKQSEKETTEKSQNGWRLLAVCSVLLSVLTRLSALGLALPVIIYCYAGASKKYKAVIMLATLASMSAFGFMFFANINGSIWGLVSHHAQQWIPSTTTEKISEVLFTRLPTIFLTFLPFFILLILIAIVFFKKDNIGIFKKITLLVKTAPEMTAFFVGITLYALLHLTTGTLHIDYFVPILPFLFVLISINLAKIQSLKWVEPTTVSSLLLMIFWYSYLFFLKPDFTGGKLPIVEVQDAAEYIQQNTTANDRVLSLEDSWIAVEANRRLLPGYSMAQFSYNPMLSMKDATDFHLVNTDMILDDINHQRSAVVIFSDLDWETFQKNNAKETIVTALENNYDLKQKITNFGQYHNTIFIYMKH